MTPILADEGLNGHFVRLLRLRGFMVDWVLEIKPGMSDHKIIELARDQKQILLTEDKDFGEWVFAHKVKGLTIVFLRYSKEDVESMLDSLAIVLQDLLDKSNTVGSHEFIAITAQKVRRRRI